MKTIEITSHDILWAPNKCMMYKSALENFPKYHETVVHLKSIRTGVIHKFIFVTYYADFKRRHIMSTFHFSDVLYKQYMGMGPYNLIEFGCGKPNIPLLYFRTCDGGLQGFPKC